MSEVTPQGQRARRDEDLAIEAEVIVLRSLLQAERRISVRDLFEESERARRAASVRREALWRLLDRREFAIDGNDVVPS